jgi:hypothetical protein
MNIFLLRNAVAVAALTLPLCATASPSTSALTASMDQPDASGLYAGLPDAASGRAPAPPTLAALAYSVGLGNDPSGAPAMRNKLLASKAIDVDGRRHIAALPPVIPIGFGLGDDLDLTIWNFIATVHAQQQARPFAVLQSQTTTLTLAVPAAVAPVPLPGALWLFVMGLLGLVGSRLGLGRNGRTTKAGASIGTGHQPAAA